MAAPGQNPILAFGKWEIDLHQRQLRASGTAVPLGGRAFDIIELLVRSAGKLVTKHDIMAGAWAGSVVEDNTLQVHISAIRRAFGADRGLLRTTSGRGYCLLGTWTPKPGTSPNPVDPAPARPAPDKPVDTLPNPGSDLLGRAAALQDLRGLLSAYRVITLTGPGGIGKTRLAVEVARDALPTFNGDVWLVELVPLTDPALVPSAVAATLGLELRGDVITADAVARAIGARKLLLVLDNCEHLIDAAALLAEALLRACPHLTLIATSREVLRIDGECAYRVAPLEVPSLAPSPTTFLAASDVFTRSAVQLFMARAKALGADISPDATTAPAIAAICRRLDGIPLAIELAAARAATLGLQQVLSRLDDRFALLTSGRRTALPRHQTLRATLDWSYELLPEAERQLLRRLSVFAGGFSLEAAAAVMSGVGTPAAAVVEGIASLAAKSLLSLDRSDQANRWRLLETTRAYAYEKLVENGEAAAAAQTHASYFQHLFAPDSLETRLEQPVTGQPRAMNQGQAPGQAGGPGQTQAPNQTQALGQTQVDAREIDNVRTALDWAFSATGNAAIAVALTIGAVPLWVRLSLMGECRGRVERALAALGRDTPDVPRARMQLNAALGWSLMFAVGRARETTAAWRTTLQLAEELDDTGYRLRSLWGLWVDTLNNGQFAAATRLAQDFGNIVASSTDVIDRMMADRMMATSLHFLGDQPGARHHIELMLSRYEMPALDPQILRFQFDQRVTAHYFQARILWLLGFADQATRLVERNIEEAQSVGNALSLGSVLGQGACPIALFTGNIEAAERHAAMLLAHAERHSLGLWKAWVRAFNGVVMVKQGKIAEGVQALRSELALAGETRVLPRYLILNAELAQSLGLAGEATLGLAAIDEVLARCEANQEGWYIAESLRIRGELIRLAGGNDPAAEALFLRAIDTAKQQGAVSWELRAAISLARLRRDQGRGADARGPLAAVYDQFKEGFGTADLQAAKQLLDELK